MNVRAQRGSSLKKDAAKDVRERYRTLELYNCQYDIQARTCSDGIIQNMQMKHAQVLGEFLTV